MHSAMDVAHHAGLVQGCMRPRAEFDSGAPLAAKNTCCSPGGPYGAANLIWIKQKCKSLIFNLIVFFDLLFLKLVVGLRSISLLMYFHNYLAIFLLFLSI